MFEETNVTIQSCSLARYNACQRQCRIAKYLDGGSITDGNCPCERPIECRFGLAQDIVEDDLMFPDCKSYIKELYSE